MDAYTAITTTGPSYTHCGEAYQTRFRTLLPVNATRGRVSMLRIRGYSRWLFDSEYVNSNSDLTNVRRKVLTESLWLVESNVTGGIDVVDIYSANNVFQQEKPNLIWQRGSFAVRDQSWDNAAGTGDNWQGFYPVNRDEIDVKVKRTWDRAQWALIYCIDYPEAGYNGVTNPARGALVLRGLFRAQDAL